MRVIRKYWGYCSTAIVFVLVFRCLNRVYFCDAAIAVFVPYFGLIVAVVGSFSVSILSFVRLPPPQYHETNSPAVTAQLIFLSSQVLPSAMVIALTLHGNGGGCVRTADTLPLEHDISELETQTHVGSDDSSTISVDSHALICPDHVV